MKNKVRHTIGFLGATVMATQLMGAPTASVVPSHSSSGSFEQAMPVTAAHKEIDRLLKQISFQAVAASNHADKLLSYARVGSRINHEGHSAELIAVKHAINAMGADFARLQALRPSALPWQQTVIDRMQPVLAGLAGNATAAIEHLNMDRRTLQSDEYRDTVSSLYAYAGEVRTLVSVNLDYAQAREKLNRLDASALEPVANLTPAREAAVPSKAATSLEQRVRTELLKLPYYGVFDHLAFQVDGSHVTLSGEVSWPTLQTQAERVVSSVEGVNSVTSHIKVLPVSTNDDQIRIATYWAIYGNSALARYRMNPHAPIRIIVENGHVTLKGVVGSEMDRTIAQMQANSVPGAFSVTNHLQLGS
ncbi:MAG TPA: BON domain-containing protein [Bryobacteraceae bacterium]|nr:BON domain-containing protein [Bryobacteraceae bacterium]